MLRNIPSFVMGKEAVFLPIVDDEVAREVEICLFRKHFHLGLRERGFEAIGHAFVVGAKCHDVTACHFEPQFPVVFSNLPKFLANHWNQNTVGIALPGVKDLRFGSESFMVDRKSTRLNSSHTVISYAVFCLKKKKN